MLFVGGRFQQMSEGWFVKVAVAVDEGMRVGSVGLPVVLLMSAVVAVLEMWVWVSRFPVMTPFLHERGLLVCYFGRQERVLGP